MRKQAAKASPFKTGVFNGATFVIGVEATNIINVGVTLKDAGHAIGVAAAVHGYLSTSATGANIAATAPSSGYAIGTNGVAIETIADKAGIFVSSAAGLFDINLTEAGVATFYLVLIMPDGSLVISGAITFA